MLSVSSDDLIQLTSNVWGAVLGMEVQPSESGTSSTSIAGRVNIQGDWNGTVVLVCSPELAAKSAQIIFSTTEAPTTDEMNDGVAELTNMIGGNLKSILPTLCKLGLPSVAPWRDNENSRAPLIEVNLSCENQPLSVMVYEGNV